MSVLVVPLVALAGGVGAIVRFALTEAGAGARLPWPVLAANLAGSFIAGLATALLDGDAAATLVVVTGFCGGLTTFSTWMVETAQLADARRLAAAIVNVVVTVAAGIALAAGGLALGALIR